ncbi:hypothetical protein [Sulfurimonas sp.]|uniref:hypothetical protein n=1 Tax=Sulfurimonas sp. TaxID=2022749 RepID=UPI002B464921|nr:hypothetical protein [Sulfurimonas sp.]
MRVLDLDKETKIKLCEAYGDTLIRIGKDEVSSDELDNILRIMFNFFSEVGGLDYKLEKDINENKKLLQEDKKIMELRKKLGTTLDRYNEANESYKEIESNERLKSHFSDDVLISESTKKVNVVESSSLELDIKTPIQGSKITVEQTKAFLTFRTSLKADQYEINNMRASLEKGYSLSESIKLVIKDTKRIQELAKLIELQNKRSQMNEDTRNFLI